MLLIRNEQIETLSEHLLRGFEERMIIHLRSKFPDQVQPMKKDDLLKFIRYGLKQAQQYGIEIEWDICRYVECMVRYGPFFDMADDFTWAAAILNDHGLSGTIKMDKIDDYEDANLK